MAISFQELNCCASGQVVLADYDELCDCLVGCAECARPLGFPCRAGDPCADGGKCETSELIPGLSMYIVGKIQFLPPALFQNPSAFAKPMAAIAVMRALPYARI